MIYVINTDASIEPCNPGGIIAWAYIVKLAKQELHRQCGISARGKDTTGNQGEYHAVMAAVLWLCKLPESEQRPAIIRSDSQLIVNQCSGKWQVKEPHLQRLHAAVTKALHTYPKQVTFTWVSREQNEDADAFSRTAYDPDEIEELRRNATQELFGDDDIPW